MQASITDSQALPPVPRPITPRGRKRSWAEAPVRLWVLLSLIVCLVTAYLFYSRISESLKERNLIYNGTKVDAIIDEIEGQTTPGIKVPRSSAPNVKMHYKASDGTDAKIEGNLTRVLEGDVVVGETLPIRIDPKDSRIWTDRTEPRGWLANLSMPLIFLPLAVVSLLILIIKRQGVLKIWKNGVPATASVVSLQHSGLAPSSRLLRYALTESEDRRVFTMLYPVQAGLPEKGDELQLIVAPNDPSRAVVAKLYM